MESNKLDALKLAIMVWKPPASFTAKDIVGMYVDIAYGFELYLTPVDRVNPLDNSKSVKTAKESRTK